MTCDPNRHKGFSALLASHPNAGLSADDMEKLYQAHRHAPTALPTTPPPAPPKFKPSREYLERAVKPVTPEMLGALSPREREAALKLFAVVREDGLAAISAKEYDDPAEADRAAQALYSGELAHVAEVTNLAALIGKKIRLTPTERQRLTVAATLHDNGKSRAPFAVHHLHAARALPDTMARAGVTLDAAGVADCQNAILRHMAFGRDDVFMRKQLCNYTAGLALMSEGEDRDTRINELLQNALLLTPEQAAPVRAYLDTKAARALNSTQLADELFKRFSPAILRYPAPNTPVARALADAAALAGEHTDEVTTDASDRTMLQKRQAASPIGERRAATFAEALREADSGVLTSASETNFGKYAFITLKAMKQEGKIPATHAIASWTGGQGHGGTAIDAAESLHIPELREAAFREIEIARGGLRAIERQTFDRWEQSELAAVTALREEAAGHRIKLRLQEAQAKAAEAQRRAEETRARREKFETQWAATERIQTEGFALYRTGKTAEARAKLRAGTDLNVLLPDEKLAHEPPYSELASIYAAHLQQHAARRSTLFGGLQPEEADVVQS